MKEGLFIVIYGIIWLVNGYYSKVILSIQDIFEKWD